VNLMTTFPQAPQASPAYPLLLLSLSSDRSQSSQWSRASDGPAGGPTVCTIHPSAATAAGVGDGQIARLESEIGAIVVRVRTDPNQRSDVAIVPKGGHLSTGHSANALIRAAITDMGEGGALYDQPVRLVPPPR
jgi:anaerobic selenocysteine-containing dehydrogenase